MRAYIKRKKTKNPSCLFHLVSSLWLIQQMVWESWRVKIRSDIYLLQHRFCWTLFLGTPNLLLWHECFTFFSELNCGFPAEKQTAEQGEKYTRTSLLKLSVAYMSRKLDLLVQACCHLSMSFPQYSWCRAKCWYRDTGFSDPVSRVLPWYSQGLYLPMYFAYTYFK